MTSLHEYSKDNLIEEGLFGIHIPSMEEIAMYVFCAIACWELIKYGGKCTIDFFKTFFTGATKMSKSLGEILGEKLRKKISVSISQAVRGVSPKEFAKELKQIKSDLNSGKISNDEVKEKMMQLIKQGAKLNDEEFDEICQELEKFTKDEQRLKKLADALNINI